MAPLIGLHGGGQRQHSYAGPGGRCGYHAVGTCAMGPEEDDVVDSQLRVRGVENLRVIDCSVMPTLVSGNTNAAAVMMAEKAVDLIRADAKAHGFSSKRKGGGLDRLPVQSVTTGD